MCTDADMLYTPACTPRVQITICRIHNPTLYRPLQLPINYAAPHRRRISQPDHSISGFPASNVELSIGAATSNHSIGVDDLDVLRRALPNLRNGFGGAFDAQSGSAARELLHRLGLRVADNAVSGISAEDATLLSSVGATAAGAGGGLADWWSDILYQSKPRDAVPRVAETSAAEQLDEEGISPSGVAAASAVSRIQLSGDRPAEQEAGAGAAAASAASSALAPRQPASVAAQPATAAAPKSMNLFAAGDGDDDDDDDDVLPVIQPAALPGAGVAAAAASDASVAGPSLASTKSQSSNRLAFKFSSAAANGGNTDAIGDIPEGITVPSSSQQQQLPQASASVAAAGSQQQHQQGRPLLVSPRGVTLWGEFAGMTLLEDGSIGDQEPHDNASAAGSGTMASSSVLDRIAPPLTNDEALLVLEKPSLAAAIRRAKRHVAAVSGAVADGPTSVGVGDDDSAQQQEGQSAPVLQPDLSTGSWASRVITDTDEWRARSLLHNLGLSKGLGIQPPPTAPGITAAATGGGAVASRSAAAPSAAAADVPSASKPSSSAKSQQAPLPRPDDLQAQALFGVGRGSQTEILAVLAAQAGGSGKAGSKDEAAAAAGAEGKDQSHASAAAASKAAHPRPGGAGAGAAGGAAVVNAGPATQAAADLESVNHAAQASELSLRSHHHRGKEWIYWHRAGPLPGDGGAAAAAQEQQQRAAANGAATGAANAAAAASAAAAAAAAAGRLLPPGVRVPILPVNANGMVVGIGNSGSSSMPMMMAPGGDTSGAGVIGLGPSSSLDVAGSSGLSSSSSAPGAGASHNSIGVLDQVLAIQASAVGGVRVATTLKQQQMGAALHGRGVGAAAGGAALHAGSGAGGASLAPGAARSRPDLSIGTSHQEVVMFEFIEQRPLFMLHEGMASRIVTYYRAINDAEVVDDWDGETGCYVRRADGAPRVDIGTLEILKSKDHFPLLGGLEPGQSMTCLVNNLYRAPIFQHRSPHDDFLMVLRSEKATPQLMADPRVKACLDANDEMMMAAAGDNEQAAALLREQQAHRKRIPVAYLRQIKRIYVVGQLQPRVEVFPPMYRGVKGTPVYDPSLLAFLKAYACWHLLSLIGEEDRAFTAQAKREGRIPSTYPGLHPGIVSARTSYASFDFSPDLPEDDYIRLTDKIATYDERHGTLSLKDKERKTEDVMAEMGLTPDRLAVYESLRAGLAVLKAAGVRVLRVADGSLDESLRALQMLYDRMVDKLKRASAQRALTNANSNTIGRSSSSSSELWEHDGGYRRLRRTLEIGQAIIYALALCPWALTTNFSAFTKKGDLSALALADPNGVGDPSGSGDFFSFIHEAASRSLTTRLRPGAGAGGAGAGGGTGNAAIDAFILDKKEGTDRDLRTLTMMTLSQMLMEYGVEPIKIRTMSRWQRVAAIRDIQNAALVASQQGQSFHLPGALTGSAAGGGAGGAGGGVDGSTMYAGEAKMTSKEKRRVKDEQAKEIMRRQTLSLSADSTAAASAAGHGTGAAATGSSAAGGDGSAMAIEDGGADGDGAAKHSEEEALDGEDGGDDEDAGGSDLDLDEEFAAELERTLTKGNKHSSGIAGHAVVQNARAIARRKAAEEDEKNEFEEFKKQLQQGTFFDKDKKGSTASTDTKTASGAGAGKPSEDDKSLSALVARYPGLPLTLFRPPHAPLVASYWDMANAPGAAAAKPAGAADGSSGASDAAASSSSSSAAAAADAALPAGALSSPNREGARNPVPVSRLPRPALEGTAEPKWFAMPEGGIGAKGKILRTVRTVIDEKGTQRVYVTYSINKYAVAQAWLKQSRGIDLGSVGPSKDILRDGLPELPEPGHPGFGLISTGVYRQKAERGVAGKRAAQDDALHFLANYHEMQQAGFTPRARTGKVVQHIYINGNPVPVCKTCSIWGHKGKWCPLQAARILQNDDPARSMSEAQIAEHVNSVRSKAVTEAMQQHAAAQSAGDNVLRLGKGAGAGDGAGGAASRLGLAASRRIAADDGKDKPVPLRRRKEVLPEPSASRKFATTLEEKLMEHAVVEVYARLWDFADPMKAPSVLSLPANQRIDVRTLRVNVVNRRYRDWPGFIGDADLMRECAKHVFGDHSQPHKAAAKLVRELRDFARMWLTPLKNQAAAAQVDLAHRVLPTAERLLVEVIAQPGFVMPSDPTVIMQQKADREAAAAAAKLQPPQPKGSVGAGAGVAGSKGAFAAALSSSAAGAGTASNGAVLGRGPGSLPASALPLAAIRSSTAVSAAPATAMPKPAAPAAGTSADDEDEEMVLDEGVVE